MNQKNEDSSSNFSLFCWNIGNPSIERAEKQAAWLHKRSEDVFILTETKESKGCSFLEEYFRTHDYDVVFPKPKEKGYGVMIVSKYLLKPSIFSNQIRYLQARVVSVKLKTSSGWLEIIGTYVPSRDSSYEKVTRKKEFLENLGSAFRSSQDGDKRIFCGDLNILEPNHVPVYSFFQKWEYSFYQNLIKHQFKDVFRYFSPDSREYSWVGRTGDGYRYDHCFASEGLLPSARECHYFHDPRKARLSDHSALIAKFNLQLTELKPKMKRTLF